MTAKESKDGQKSLEDKEGYGGEELENIKNCGKFIMAQIFVRRF